MLGGTSLCRLVKGWAGEAGLGRGILCYSTAFDRLSRRRTGGNFYGLSDYVTSRAMGLKLTRDNID